MVIVAVSMSTGASTLAQALAQYGDEDVLQALHLFDSLRPHLREAITNMMSQDPLKRYTGTLSNFNYEKGYGFISSEGVTADFGKDAFCSGNEIGDYKKGTNVTFTVVTNKNDQPQARLVQGPDGKIPLFLDFAPQLAPHLGAAPQLAPQQQTYQQTYVPPMPPAPAQPMPVVLGPVIGEPAAKMRKISNASWEGGSSPSRYAGTIVQYYPEKNFGFISSTAGTADYGKDTFVSSMEIGNFKIGDIVNFDIAVNRNGQPQARNLQAGVMQTGSIQNAPPQTSGPAWTANSQAWTANSQAWIGGGEAHNWGEDQTRYAGIISQFNAEKHFGFIQCAETQAVYEKDVFVSDKEIGNFNVGARISFRVVLNQRGHPQARDLAAV